MKPAWIVLLLVSLTLFHLDVSSQTPNPNPTPPPAAKDQLNTTQAGQPKKTNEENDGSSDNMAEGGFRGADTMNNASSNASQNDSSKTAPPPAVENQLNTTQAGNSAKNESADIPLSGTNSHTSGNPTNGSDTSISSISPETSNGTTVNTSSETVATLPEGKLNDQIPETGGTSPAPVTSAAAPGPTQDNQLKEQSGEDLAKEPETDRRILWILLPVLGVLVAGVLFVLKFKCMKVSDHAEPTENGTENASFQRSDSNKDNVMLVGVKTSGGEENVAAR